MKAHSVIKKWNYALMNKLFDSNRINAVRGLACALLVAHHATISTVDYRGLDGTVALNIDAALSYFRMPAFAFISGLILGISSSRIDTSHFIIKKFQRIIIPFLTVTVLLIAGRSATSADVSVLDFPYFWLYPHSHMWFLPAVFLFFLASILTACFLDLRSERGSVIFLLAAILISFLPISEAAPLALSRASNLFPYFALGLAFSEVYRSKNLIRTSSIILAIAAIALLAGITLNSPNPSAILISYTLVIAVFCTMPRIGFLVWIWRYSLSIYLFHGILVSLGIRFMPDATYIAAIGTYTLAILVPVLIEFSIRKILPVALPLIGQSRSTPAPKASRVINA
jgi:hypothetical protein